MQVCHFQGRPTSTIRGSAGERAKFARAAFGLEQHPLPWVTARGKQSREPARDPWPSAVESTVVAELSSCSCSAPRNQPYASYWPSSQNMGKAPGSCQGCMTSFVKLALPRRTPLSHIRPLRQPPGFLEAVRCTCLLSSRARPFQDTHTTVESARPLAGSGRCTTSSFSSAVAPHCPMHLSR